MIPGGLQPLGALRPLGEIPVGDLPPAGKVRLYLTPFAMRRVPRNEGASRQLAPMELKLGAPPVAVEA